MPRKPEKVDSGKSKPEWNKRFGKTAYPRWTALANFGVLSLLAPLAERIPASLGAVVVGGFTNLSIAFFFLVSVISTWRRAAASPLVADVLTS